jgi:CO dehydrogenase maturation factor
MIVAVVGKGGVGKTTISSLLLRCLIEAGKTPLLAIDADPSNCLGPALGIKVEKSVADLRERMRENDEKPSSMSSGEWWALLAEEAISENNGFDLLTMGRPEGKGCYCFVNNLIRDHLDRLAKSYRHIVLDCEAGLEHLSRRTGGRPDALVCVTNRSRMAAETIRRCLSLFENLHGALPPRVDLMLNGFEEGDSQALAAAEIAGGGRNCFTRTFFVPRDASVALFESMGRPLFELDSQAPALRALRGWVEDL